MQFFIIELFFRCNYIAFVVYKENGFIVTTWH